MFDVAPATTPWYTVAMTSKFTVLLNDTLAKKGWKVTDLRIILTERGFPVSDQTVRMWKVGAMKPRDSIRPAVAAALDIPLDTLLRACAGVE